MLKLSRIIAMFVLSGVASIGIARRDINMILHNDSSHPIKVLRAHVSDKHCTAQTELGEQEVVLLPGQSMAAVGSSHHFYHCNKKGTNFAILPNQHIEMETDAGLFFIRRSNSPVPTQNIICSVSTHQNAKFKAVVNQCGDPRRDFSTAELTFVDK